MFWSALSSMKDMKPTLSLAALWLLAVLPHAPADPALELDRNGDGKPDQWYEVTDGRVVGSRMDRNYDGQVDYIVEYDADNRKVREEMDFNYDGRMDDFYFFEDGHLVREEVDSNFDGRIDLWVHLEGQYVRSYEMDRDFDGVAEVRKAFGP